MKKQQNNFENIPSEMQVTDCWINWKKEIKDGRPTKVPYQPNGVLAKVNDISTWNNVNRVIDALENSEFSGIGFVFTLESNLVAIDIDDCFNNGVLTQDAKKWIETFDSYTELSQSGKGIHIIVESDKSEVKKLFEDVYNKTTGTKINGKGECYIYNRFFAITGNIFENRSKINSVDISTIDDFMSYLLPNKQQVTNKACNLKRSPQMSDEEILKKAFAAKNGSNFTTLYNQIGKQGNSETDLAICNLIAFYTQEVKQIKRILKTSPRYRAKFDNHATYLDITIEEALEGLTATYQPDYNKTNIQWDKKHIHVNSKGVESPLMSLSNLRILCEHEGIEIKINEMSHDLELNGEKVEDRHDVMIKDLTQEHHFKNASMEAVSKYMDALGNENTYHPVKDFLDSLPHTDSCTEFEKLCNTIILENPDDKAYADMLLKKWLISCVAAIYKPDFKSQGSLTFQGKGGIFKSTWFSKLFPHKSWFKGEFVGLDVHDKDKISKAIKYWVVELAELESTMKKDFTALKGFITDEFDEYRAAYDRRIKKYKRKTVFCASVNPKEFIKDDTGDRRFWTVEIKDLDISTKIDLNRLWSEIKTMYESGEIYYLNREETETVVNHNREYSIKSSLDDAIAALIDPDETTKEYTAQDVIDKLRGTGYFSEITSTKVSRALHKIGYKNKKKKRNGEVVRIFDLKLKSLKI